jgi:hypothetical protein
MRRRFLIAIAALLASTTVTGAATLELSGARGQNKLTTGGCDLYLPDATWSVNVQQNNPNANTGVLITSSPAGATWRGGQIKGVGINLTEARETLYHRVEPGNGAAMLFENSPNFTAERVFVEWSWDGFRAAGGSPNWTVRHNWLRHVRDDGIMENDHCYDGRVDRNLVEDVHTIYSARPGGDSSSTCPYTLEFTGNVVSMGKHWEDRPDWMYQYSNRDGDKVMQSGQFFKVRGEGANTKVLFRDNVIKTDHIPGTPSLSKVRLVPHDWQFLPGSGNNTFIWTGADNIPGVTYETVDGCSIPSAFKVRRDLFRVLCGATGQQAWDNARAQWIAEVWEGASPPPDGAEPPPQDEAESTICRLQR